MATPTQRRSHRAAWAVVAVAAVASLVGRLLLARSVVSPFMFQDEVGYVGVARLLAGDGPSLYGFTYFPGWGLLLAGPAAFLEPGAFQDVAQAANALAAAATIPVLHLVGLRVARLRPSLSAGAAVVGGLTAASIVQATMLLPEVLLVLVVALGVLALHRALQTPTVGWSIVAGLVVGASYAVHPRSLVAVLALLAIAVLGWRFGELPARAATGLAASALATVVITQFMHAWATSRLYPSGTMPSLAGSPLGALREPVGAAVIAAGQSWYVIVATLGLAPLGLFVAGRVGWEERTSARGLTMTFILLGALGSLALGTIGSYEVGAGIDVTRADLPVYGRYLEHWVPVLVVLAVALGRGRMVRAFVVTAVASLVLGAAVQVAQPSATWDLPVAWHNIASLQVPIDLFGPRHVLATSVAAAVAIVLLGAVVVACRGGRGWVVLLAAVAALNLQGGITLVHEWAGPSSEAWAARHGLGPVLEATGLTVWVDRTEYLEVAWAYNLQFWHPGASVAYFEGAPPEEAVLVAGVGSAPPAPRATPMAAEADGTITLWELAP